MTVLVRYLAKSGNAKWAYVEHRDGRYSDGTKETAFQSAIKRLRLYPEEYQAWAIIRLSDMRILAQSKGYTP